MKKEAMLRRKINTFISIAYIYYLVIRPEGLITQSIMKNRNYVSCQNLSLYTQKDRY
jgi:hypothetical protein